VAVLGSVWSSSYHAQLVRQARGARIPVAAIEASRRSVGAAVTAAHTLAPGPRVGLVGIAKSAFVHGSNVACVVAAVTAIVGAGLAFRYLPRPAAPADAVVGEIAETGWMPEAEPA
jgi:DHA2 family multidrug resistance protein-like MFS transporter